VRKSIKILMAAMTVVLALLIQTGTAAALRSIVIRGGERVASAGRLVIGENALGATGRITCNVTLLKTMAAGVIKTAGTVFGKITGIAIDRGEPTNAHCQKGTAIEGINDIVPLRNTSEPGGHTELGNGILLYNVTNGGVQLWNMVYDSFQGTLPAIDGINYHIEEAQIRLDLRVLSANIMCLYKGNMGKLITIERGTMLRLDIVLATTSLARVSGAMTCPTGPLRMSTVAGMTMEPRPTIRLL